MGPPPVDPEERGRGSLTVEVASVEGGRRPGRSRRAAQLVAIAVLVVLALAVASSRLFPVQPDTIVLPSLVPPSAAASPSIPPDGSPSSAPAEVLTPRVVGVAVDVSALVAAVATGRDGPLAFLAGILRITPRRCEVEATASACYELSIDGLRGVRVVPDDGLAVPMRQPGAGEVLVLLPRAGRLVYLGSLVEDPAGIPRIDAFATRLAPGGPLLAGRGPTLYEADGRLIRLSHDCPETASCPPSSWLLSGGAGLDAQANDVVDAAVAPGAFGIVSNVGAASGPFLLRPGTTPGASWIVVAREDQAKVLHVLIP
jgi:hypothetical protein